MNFQRSWWLIAIWLIIGWSHATGLRAEPAAPAQATSAVFSLFPTPGSRPVWARRVLPASYRMAVSRNSGYWFVGHTITVQLTAYASVPQHTDSTPWITASGSRPRFGTLAHNGLPFGTVVRLPEVFGNQTFTVEDRMNERYGDEYADVWLPTDAEAHAFRVRRDTPMVIVALPHPEP